MYKLTVDPERTPDRLFMYKPYLFTFWEPVKGTPDYIDVARNLFEHHLSSAFEHVHLDLAEARKWSDRVDEFLSIAEPYALGKSSSIEGRRIAIFTDLLRIDLVSRYGGLWIDADTLVMPSAAQLAKTVTNYDFFCSESEQLTLANGIMGGKRGSVFLSKLNEEMSKKLSDDTFSGKLHWGEMGFKLIEKVFVSTPNAKVFVAPFGLLIQNFGDLYHSSFSESANFNSVVAPGALALSMSNSSSPASIRDLSTEELLSADTVFARFHHISMNQADSSVVQSVPDAPCFNISEYLRGPLTKRKDRINSISKQKIKIDERNQRLHKVTEQRDNIKIKLQAANDRVASLREQVRRRVVDSQAGNLTDGRKNVFSEIYEHGLWKQGGSFSGCGSSLRQTEALRGKLPALLDKWNIRSVLDIPCGDFNWMQTLDLQDRKYIGADIVPQIIKDNQRYAKNNISFLVADIVEDKLPECDCVLVRDCFSHLNFDEIQSALRNIRHSGSRYLLVTHYLNQQENENIKTGDFHRLNFTLSPFNFAPPIDVLIEEHPNPKHADKALALWKVDSLIQGKAESSIETYDELLATDTWQRQLAGLNAAIIEELDRFDAPRLINGNLFYDHLQTNFEKAALMPECNKKRRRLYQAACQSSCMFEIGVNGGHSMFLSLMANPKLKCIGVDICKQLAPTWGRVDLFVPAAIRWLKTNLKANVLLLEGDSRIVIPQYVASQNRENQPVNIDLLHLDGDKKNYLTDFINVQPLLAEGATIIVDDTNMAMCKKAVEQMIAIGYAEPHPDYLDFNDEKYQNTVLRKTN